jgi:molybdopterin/thiamine biosynthesis adenylyltransferase
MSDGVEKLKVSLDEDRFHRFRLIPWWKQELLKDARVLVLGAGALGNEIVKNLALLGVGHIRIVDFDHVENSNLSRSVLFTQGDEGKLKCEVAAAAAKRIYPEIDAAGLEKDIIFDLGWGWYLDADVVLTGLDGREARLAANRACAFVKKPFIDGAIEGIDGVARTFKAWEGPCYECTMSEKDWELIHHRRSCNLLSRDQMMGGHVPTTSTVGSVIAGLQVQQALKVLHGMDAQAGVGLQFNGISFEAYSVAYQKQEECFAHDHSEKVERLDWKAGEMTVGGAIAHAAKVMGEGAVLELRGDVVTARRCRCGFVDHPMKPLLRLTQGAGVCPVAGCGKQLALDSIHTVKAGSALEGCTLKAIGVAEYDILRFRKGGAFYDVVLDGDRPSGWPRMGVSRREGGETEGVQRDTGANTSGSRKVSGTGTLVLNLDDILGIGGSDESK